MTRLLCVLSVVAVCVAVGLLWYFAPWKKSGKDSGSISTESIESPAGLPKASKKKPFINTLGMQFVPMRERVILRGSHHPIA